MSITWSIILFSSTPYAAQLDGRRAAAACCGVGGPPSLQRGRAELSTSASDVGHLGTAGHATGAGLLSGLAALSTDHTLTE